MPREYTKTRGSHCWWLNIGGKAVANFDIESDVDEIIALKKFDSVVRDQIDSYMNAESEPEVPPMVHRENIANTLNTLLSIAGLDIQKLR